MPALRQIPGAAVPGQGSTLFWVLNLGRLWISCAILIGSASFTPAGAGDTNIAEANFLVNSWHTESGLPDGNVTALAQTLDGYLWIGTFKGLARFDGVRFTVFDARREKALADDHITGLLADKDGRLWVACESGVILKHERGRFAEMPGIPLLPGGGKGALRSTHSRLLRATGMAEDEQGGIWVYDGRPMLLRLGNGGSPRVFSVTNGLRNMLVTSFRQPAAAEEPGSDLSRCEEEVLGLIFKGYANKEIADRLSLSVETVRTHLKRIYENLHVRCRTEAAMKYREGRERSGGTPGNQLP